MSTPLLPDGPPAPAQAIAASAARLHSGLARLALAVGGVTLVLLAALWWTERNQMEELRQQLGARLAEMDGANKQGLALAKETGENSKRALEQLAQLESKLAESQSHQLALEAMYQELTRNRDERLLAEVEQLLDIASQQLQLAGNVKAALIALQAADARLLRAENPLWIGLRKAINQDMDKLKRLPFIDTVGLSVKLDNLIGQVDGLPLMALPGIQAEPAADLRQPASGSYWRDLGREVWQDIRQLVRIRDIGKPEAPLLAPGQEYFLRENLKLRLLSARLALLARDQISYQGDLKAAQDWLQQHFDPRAHPTATALTGLHQLAGEAIDIAAPTLQPSLEAARSLRLAREKTNR